GLDEIVQIVLEQHGARAPASLRVLESGLVGGGSLRLQIRVADDGEAAAAAYRLILRRQLLQRRRLEAPADAALEDERLASVIDQISARAGLGTVFLVTIEAAAEH